MTTYQDLADQTAELSKFMNEIYGQYPNLNTFQMLCIG